jgi:hypothetical protein
VTLTLTEAAVSDGGQRPANNSKTPTAKAIIVTPLTPLLLSLAGGSRRAAAAAAREGWRVNPMYHPAAARLHLRHLPILNEFG